MCCRCGNNNVAGTEERCCGNNNVAGIEERGNRGRRCYFVSYTYGPFCGRFPGVGGVEDEEETEDRRRRRCCCCCCCCCRR